MKKYKELIPFVYFKSNDKDVDVFNSEECVICMDAFVEGAQLRQLPTCKHIFHDDCLMDWMSSDKQLEFQKCPQCNTEINPQLIEKAIQEQSKGFGTITKMN